MSINDGFGGFDGHRKRAMLTQGGVKTMFIGPMFLDICMQDRFLIPLTNLEFTFTLSRPEFALRVHTETDQNYKFVIDNFKILLNRVRVTPSVAAAVEQKLTRSPALYPIRACTAKVFTIPERAKNYECSPFGQVRSRRRPEAVRRSFRKRRR